MTADSASLRQAILGRDGKIWIVVGLLAIAFLATSLLRTINGPWAEDDNAFGAAYAQAARNNLRAGISVTAGVPATLYAGPLPIPPNAYYVHHPVLFPLFVTASVAALGEKEWTVRLVSIVCSILSALFLWVLVQDAMGKRAAAFVVAVFVTLPMELHYGDLVDFEPCLVMWMLAALICLRRWKRDGAMRWKVFAGLCCLCALWTDWPGYLFTAAVCGWLFFQRDRRSRRFALALVGLAAGSAALFLLQIRHVNPEAWRDLWTAITMRLGNGIQPGSSPNGSSGPVRFGFGEWLRRILQSLDQNYLRATWGLVVVGAISLFRDRKSAGPRSMGWASLLLIAAGIPYLVILQNWSYVHDFASIFVIGGIAILGGVGLEAIWQWVERRGESTTQRWIAAVATLLVLPSLAWAGSSRAEEQRSQFLILDGVSAEPASLIPDLGRYLATVFPASATILCNFDPYYSPLSYYAKTTILRNVTTADEWNRAAGGEPENAGGILWLGAPSTQEIIAMLPAGEMSEVQIDGVRFVIWRRRDGGAPGSNTAR
jgi:4-amino-4-deoxy-L-arabinose transferase-like glycosyltransferase